MSKLILRPILTEESLRRAAGGWYTFAAPAGTRKPQIAAAVREFFKVEVTGVRTATQHGKTRRSGRRMVTVEKPDWKKAFVRLKAGQTIEAFSVPSKAPEQKSEKK